MITYGFLSLIPAFLAIFLAIYTGQVVPSLLLGIFVGYAILQEGDLLQALLATLDALVNIFAEAWVVKTIFFSFLVGAFLVLVQASGGVQGLIDALTKKKQWIQSKKAALLLAYFIGILVFIESSITILLSGAIARPLTEKFKVSKAKLAYVCDSTSAPICGLIPLNAWGATIMGAIAAQVQKGLIDVNPVELLIQSLPYQLYSFAALFLVLCVILSGKDIGLMQKLEQKALTSATEKNEKSLTVDLDIPMHVQTTPNFWYLLIPVFILIGMIPFALWVTGKGIMMQGSGSTAVFWAVCAALAAMAIYYVGLKKIFSLADFMDYFYKGIANMVPIASILIFAFAMGSVLGQLETGKYLASFMGNHLSAATLPAFIFILSGMMAFATGTSFGTFSIMIPIGLQMGVPLEANLPLILGAVISGGIFGDHCSPISDTTIMASMVSGCPHIEHVKSQMPYAFLSAFIAFLGFLFLGFFI